MPMPESPAPTISTSRVSLISSPPQGGAEKSGGLVERGARLRHHAMQELPHMRRTAPDLDFHRRPRRLRGRREAHGIVAQDFAFADMEQHWRQTREIAE